MLHPRFSGRRADLPLAGVLLAAASLALAFVASCNGPQSPASTAGNATFRGLYDHGGNALEFRIETATGGVSPLRLVASNPSFDTATLQLHAQVAIRNAGGETLLGPAAVQVDVFDPESVQPVNAAPMRCPTSSRCVGIWEFIHAGTYGDDGLLSPGETSTPIEWIFADSTGESFSFRAVLRPGEVTRPGVISGSVFADLNGDGLRQPTEVGVAAAAVSLVHAGSTATTHTGDAGDFEFKVDAAGLYEVVRDPTSECDPTTPSSRQVFIIMRPDGTLSGYSGIAFGCRGTSPGDGASVEGVVFEDTNHDGVRGDEERGLPDVEVIAGGIECATPVVGVTHTDALGRYILRQTDVHCPPPWRVTRGPLAGMCDTSPNPVDVCGDGPPLARHFRVDFGVASCDSLPTGGRLVVFVYWQKQGLEGRRLVIKELDLERITNSAGLAEFVLPAATYTLHADVNRPGPPLGVDLSVTVFGGRTTRVEVIDCTPCVSPQ